MFCFFFCSWQISSISSQLEHWVPCCSFRRTCSSSFFCSWLIIIARKSLHFSVVWLHFPCRMQYLLTGLCSKEESSLDSTTLESESSCFFFSVDFLSFYFLVTTCRRFFFSSLGVKFSTLILKKSVILSQ